jgi:hypothetical protein
VVQVARDLRELRPPRGHRPPAAGRQLGLGHGVGSQRTLREDGSERREQRGAVDVRLRTRVNP